MSEYQYYEFRAMDRPLDRAEQAQLRALSSRAQITATKFVNHYDWGDFRGDPDRLMDRFFDLFLYVASWGQRRLSIRLPRRLLDEAALKPFVGGSDGMTVRRAGDNLIVDLTLQDIETEDHIDGEGWMDAFALLRGDILDGDLRLFYLGWLMSVQFEEAPENASEPLAGIGPLTPSLEAFAELFCIDKHLVAAAAEVTYASSAAEPSQAAVAKMIDGLDAHEKSAYLLRAYERDPHLRAELRHRCQSFPMSSSKDRQPPRSVADLRAAANRLMENNRRAEERKRQAEEKRRKEAEDRARDIRLKALVQRGTSAWGDVESLIALRNNAVYDQATAMLCDLRELALRQGSDDEFHRRLIELRGRHKSKPRFIERLITAGLI
jgi:hypothetical protein